MDDDRLIDDASAIADRRPAKTTSSSRGIRILDHIGRLFRAPAAGQKESETDALFVWGALQVRHLIGAGSFGEVYEAWDPTLHREVALKLRSPETGTLRWLDEARNLARVRHPNVLTVHGADVSDGRAGIWTERVLGRTLEEELVTSGPFPEAEVLRIGRDIASALAAVHAAGLIHGDVKTSNIMLEDGDAPRRAVLVDFGSADRQPGDDDVPAYAMGTPLTMAPEVLDGKSASPGADVYGLGATLYRLLTGRYPVEGASIEALRTAHRSHERARVRAHAPQASQRLTRAIERALEPDPAQRWPTARSFGKALEDAADPTQRIRTRATAIGAGVAALAAVTFLAFLVLRPGAGPISRGRLSVPRDVNAYREAWRWTGSEEKSGFGYVGAVVDLDHDGYADVIGVEPHWAGPDEKWRGRMLFFRGGPGGPAKEPSTIIEGDVPDATVGYQVIGVHDTNGDGFDDLLVSQETRVDIAKPFARVRIYAGAPAGKPIVPIWEYTSYGFDPGLGRAMTDMGDVNGDGFDDIAVGELNAPGLQFQEGAVLLFYGGRNGLSKEPAWMAKGGQSGALMGSWMHRLGDVNKDGYDDVLVGANTWDGVQKLDCGQARLYFGGPNGPGNEPAWTFEGAAASSHLTTEVGGAGDVNGDGYPDAIVGEHLYSDVKHPERGRVLVFLGNAKGFKSTPDWVAYGPVAYAHFGFRAIGIGDMNQDGFDDIAIASPTYTDGKRVHLGMIEVYRGSRSGCESTPAWRMLGSGDEDHFGYILTSGDVNGDHIPDLLVGAPIWSDGKVAERGMLVVYLARSPRK
jgi:hypothetical protein